MLWDRLFINLNPQSRPQIFTRRKLSECLVLNTRKCPGWLVNLSGNLVVANSMYDHHHHHVACPCWSVAVSTISRLSSRSYALCLADHSPRFCCLRSFSIVRSHVWRGRPCSRLHSFGGSSMPALRAHMWSSSESERTIWPKNLRRLAMTDRWTCTM